jgi:four helix bundle protein
MDPKSKFIPLYDLEVYRLARKLSAIGWVIYKRLTFQEKKVWGDQMISSIDSVGANIAEGYARFHYSDKSRFYYISRASLSEGVEHWIDLGYEREIVLTAEFEESTELKTTIQIKLNNMIKATMNAKSEGK